MEMKNLMTSHAESRSSQRGIKEHQINVVLEHIKPQYKRCALFYIVLDKDIDRLLKIGIIGKQESDKFHNLVIITSRESGQIITLYHASIGTIKKLHRI